LIGFLQDGQYEGGDTIDSSRGILQISTLKNEPTTEPKIKKRILKYTTGSIIVLIVPQNVVV
jgi:hypothetical protein